MEPQNSNDVVPHSERRSSITMGLLWITMVTGFPAVLIGFQWFKQGLTLPQVVASTIISALILLAYSIPACYLGAKTGQTYTRLSRRAFGERGSWLVSFNIIASATAWYALTAIFLAEGLRSLYHIDLSMMWLAAVLAVCMAFNNFFGFSGVANFARYLAGPVLIAWVVYSLGLASSQLPAETWSQPVQMPFLSALTAVSSFVIGYAVWGNEADYWRYAKNGVGRIVGALTVSLAIGDIAFPIAGWMVASITNTTDPSNATAVMNAFAFGDARTLAAVVLVMTYVAVNDSLLFATVNAVENVYPLPRRVRVVGLAVIGAVLAALLSQNSRAFDVIAALTSIILPAATTIVMLEWFFPRKQAKAPGDAEQAQAVGAPADSTDGAPSGIGWAAVIALFVGVGVGVFTSDVLPGWEALGVPTLQAWLASMFTYAVLRRII